MSSKKLIRLIGSQWLLGRGGERSKIDIRGGFARREQASERVGCPMPAKDLVERATQEIKKRAESLDAKLAELS